jgi:hypothetical protein
MSCIKFHGKRFLMAGSTPGGTGQFWQPLGAKAGSEGDAVGLEAMDEDAPAGWPFPPWTVPPLATTSGKSCHMEEGTPGGNGGSLLRVESSISARLLGWSDGW